MKPGETDLDHQRKLITLRAGWPDEGAPDREERVLGLVGWLADANGKVDISDHELGTLGGLPTEDVRAALAALVAGRMITVEPVSDSRPPGPRMAMCTCPRCGRPFQSVHPRALELDVMSHLDQAHGERVPFVLLAPRGSHTVH